MPQATCQQAMPLAVAKAIYRKAIDPTASDAEDADWWESVRAEVQAVAGAFSNEIAVAVIAWWHHDWTAVGDTALRAARRIRTAARKAQQPRS